MSDRLLPCGSCPWRLGAAADRIPGLSVDMARGLARTCPTNTDGLGVPMMACHHSPEGEETVCIGWALSDASRNNIPLRLAMVHGDVPGWRLLHDVAAAAGVEVYASHAEMLAQIEASA